MPGAGGGMGDSDSSFAGLWPRLPSSLKKTIRHPGMGDSHPQLGYDHLFFFTGGHIPGGDSESSCAGLWPLLSLLYGGMFAWGEGILIHYWVMATSFSVPGAIYGG